MLAEILGLGIYASVCASRAGHGQSGYDSASRIVGDFSLVVFRGLLDSSGAA